MDRTTKITYESPYQPAVTIPLGRRKNVDREGDCLDVYLSRALAFDCPLRLSLLIRTDGTVVEWDAEFEVGSNTYWHVTGGLPATLTPQQLETLARIHYETLSVFGGVRGGLGRSATDAFKGYTLQQIEAMGRVALGSVAYNGE